MDSGNSGSLQSSSGGDEEYDSRAADSVSAFLTGGGGGGGGVGGGPISNHTPLPHPFFDPLSNYLQLHQNHPLLNSGPAWPRSGPTLRPGPNQLPNDHVTCMLPGGGAPFMPSFHPAPAALGLENAALAPPLQNQTTAAARNPKKRSRASRRAPTTVLTTDTTNFRAMVQEFTGIPAPPFNNSSFPRSRLDLFATTRSASLDAAHPPPYLRRPFPQKVQPQHSLLSSAALDAIAAASSPPSTASAAASSSINYQLPITQNSNLFNVNPNPLLTSFLQSNPKFPFSTSPIISNPKPTTPFMKMGGLDEHFSLNSVSDHGLENLIQNDVGESNNAGRWNNNNQAVEEHKDDNNYGFPRNGATKMNALSGSSTYGGKAAESVGGRGEGMVESWICSSE